LKVVFSITDVIMQIIYCVIPNVVFHHRVISIELYMMY